MSLDVYSGPGLQQILMINNSNDKFSTKVVNDTLKYYKNERLTSKTCSKEHLCKNILHKLWEKWFVREYRNVSAKFFKAADLTIYLHNGEWGEFVNLVCLNIGSLDVLRIDGQICEVLGKHRSGVSEVGPVHILHMFTLHLQEQEKVRECLSVNRRLGHLWFCTHNTFLNRLDHQQKFKSSRKLTECLF